MPNKAISAFDALPDATSAELLADRLGSTGKLTPEQLVTSRLASTTPAAVGSASVGVGTTAARADHVHAHGDQAGGSLHAVAVAGVSAGFMSAAQATALEAAEEALTYPATTAATAITLDADDDRTVIRCTAGSTVTVTVPSLAQGTAILLIQEGAGQIQLSASGVTLHHPATFLARAAEQYSEVLLHWKTTTLVQVSGDLEVAP